MTTTVDKPATKDAPSVEAAPPIHIDRVSLETVMVPIVGTAPLIMCRFPEKAKQAMLAAMQRRTPPKEIKKPEVEFEAAMHRVKGGYGFPSVGFKAATIGAARFYGKSVTMIELRQLMYFDGEPSIDPPTQKLVRLETSDPIMREDYVRVSTSGTDLRYRPEFSEWRATLLITYVTSSLSEQSLLSLVEAGGMGGIGEWRPAGKKTTGDFGTYIIDPTREVMTVSRGV